MALIKTDTCFTYLQWGQIHFDVAFQCYQEKFLQPTPNLTSKELLHPLLEVGKM